MLPQGSIFQYGFLGGGQFKEPLKKWTYSRKPPKTGLFTLPGVLFKSEAAL